MRLSLETSAYSHFERNRLDIRETLERADEIWVSAIVLGELRSGFLGGSRQALNEHRLALFLARPAVNIGAVDGQTAARYADILTFLNRAGTPLPTNDIWIAAHAMQHGLQVVTFDRHFQRMPQVSILLFEP
jgi:tRNA(fMet)-specific endonuclease VapC